MRTRDPRVSNWFKIVPETALGRTTVLVRLVDNEGFDYDAGVTDVQFDIVAMYQDVMSVSKTSRRNLRTTDAPVGHRNTRLKFSSKSKDFASPAPKKKKINEK